MALREDVWHYEVDDYAMAASRFLPAQQRLEIKTLIVIKKNFFIELLNND